MISGSSWSRARHLAFSWIADIQICVFLCTKTQLASSNDSDTSIIFGKQSFEQTATIRCGFSLSLEAFLRFIF